MLVLLEQERIIDKEILEEIERFRGARDAGMDLDFDNIRVAESDEEPNDQMDSPANQRVENQNSNSMRASQQDSSMISASGASQNFSNT